MSIDVSITDWRAADTRQRALAVVVAQREAQKTPVRLDDDTVLDILDAAVNKAIRDFAIPADHRIDAQVQFHPDPTGAHQMNIWFRWYPPPPEE